MADTCDNDACDDAEVSLCADSKLTAGECNKIESGIPEQFTTAPGSPAPATDAVSIGVDTGDGADIKTITTTSLTTKAEDFTAENADGLQPHVWDLQIDFPDIGDTGDVMTLTIPIIR